MTAGSGTSGSGGQVELLAGSSNHCTGGAIVALSGEGTASSSGLIHFGSANSGLTVSVGNWFLALGLPKRGIVVL